MNVSVLGNPATIVIDCADPGALAGFYGKATGWETTYQDDDYVTLGGGPLPLGFQRVAGYRAPAWPAASANLHLDFKVPDIEAAAKELIALGATRPENQSGEGWIVLTDPEGHAFCVTA
jgi:predicted enzyme related to lactoylglutathione lyase